MKQLLRPVFCIFTILLFACNGAEPARALKAPAPDTTLPPPPPVFPSTSMKVVPLRKLPNGYRLDSLMLNDTTVDHQVLVYFPVSIENKAFNTRMQTFIRKQMKDYFPDRPREAYQSSEFEMWVTGVDTGKHSVRFMLQSYYSGAAHFNQDSTVFVFSGH